MKGIFREDCWLIRLILIIAIIILAIFCFVTRKSSSSNEALEINSFSSTEFSGAIYIPTVFELQTALCNAGYTVEVDCVVGDETIAAWDSYCADRMAAKFMTNTGEPNENK